MIKIKEKIILTGFTPYREHVLPMPGRAKKENGNSVMISLGSLIAVIIESSINSIHNKGADESLLNIYFKIIK